MIKLGHKIILAVLALLITPPLGFAAETADASASVQDRKVTVRGTVNDAAGQPLLGVTVLVEGTTTGTSTGIDGTYEISCAPDAELTFSFIGYESQTLPVANRTLLDVTLAEDSQMVDDVIVIGYGTTTRRSTVGAVDQIKSEAIAERRWPTSRRRCRVRRPASLSSSEAVTRPTTSSTSTSAVSVR